MMKKIALAILATASIAALPALSGQVSANTGGGAGDEGCTPGYWKTHTDNWDNAYPTKTLDLIFGDIFDTEVTMLEALQGGGGRGIEGAQRILARAATAAFLNLSHSDVDYELTYGELREEVQGVWDSGSRGEILDLAAELDELNNLGCPLN